MVDWQVLTAVVRFAVGVGPHDHVTKHLMKLHWLPISSKLCLMIHAAVNSQCPSYIRHIITSLSTLPGRNRLCAAATAQFDIHRTRSVFGERAFSVVGPRKWNSLPPDISNIDNEETFKRALKN